MNQRQKRQNLGKAVSLLIPSIGLILTGCSKSSSSTASGSDVALSGSLSTVSSGTTAKESHEMYEGAPKDLSQSFTGDSVVCATLSNPPTTATAAVNADGSFSITIVGGVNQPMNCNLINSSGSILAALVTSDSTHTDMNNNPTTQSTVAYTASANLGSISYDPTTGKASIPVANIQSALAAAPAAANVYDPTGEWTITAVPFALPKGYSGLCAQNSNNCNGPPAGQLLQLQQYKGVQTSDESTAVFGLQIWQGGAASRNACGSKIGMTHAEAVAVGVDFSATGLEGAFTYASTVTINGQSKAITNDYEIAGATSTYSTQLGCGSQTVTVAGVSQLGWVCAGKAMDGSTNLYQASVGGGCVATSTGLPIQVNGNWTNTGSCTTTTVGGGYSIQSCPGTYNGTAITCTNESGVFTSSSLTTPVTFNQSNTATQFNWNSLTQVAQGSDCTTGFTGYPLLQAQCYAQYFQQNVGDHSTACLKRVDTDWSASTAANFLHIGNNPGSLVAFNEFHPDPTGQGGAMRMEQNQIQGVQSASGQGYTPCNTFEVDEFSYKKIDSSTLLATYQSTTIATDTSKADCVAAFGSAGNGSVQKFLFLLKK